LLEEAYLHNAQLNNKNWRSAMFCDRLSKRYNDCISLLKMLAQDQSQQRDESHKDKALLATAEMDIQHECQRHQDTQISLDHERKVTSRLTDYINRLPVNFSTECVMDLEQRIKQMEKDLQAKDTLIQRQQTTFEQLMEERDDIIAARACSV